MKKPRGYPQNQKKGGVSNPRPVRVRNIKDATRLLARVLIQLQKDMISENKARTISYVCNSYIRAFEVSTLEVRIQALESAYQESVPRPAGSRDAA